MASKSSTTYDDEEDDFDSFIPWLELLVEVDDTSNDLLLSHEEVLTERYLKAGTLPAILRRLTLVETASQSQIWAFLLHHRMFIGSKYLLSFLIKRFYLSPEVVDRYASMIRNEVYSPGIVSSLEIESEKYTATSAGLSQPELLGEDRHLIGPQFYWLSTTSELLQHQDSLSSRSLSLFCERDDIDRLVLESYSSIQIGVLIFLETWLQYFSEDFLLTTARVHSKKSKQTLNLESEFLEVQSLPSPSNTPQRECEEIKSEPEVWIDESDDTALTAELIHFLRSFARCPMFQVLGGKIQKAKTTQDLGANDLISITISSGSQLKISFPCLSTLLEVITTDDSLATFLKDTLVPSPKHEITPLLDVSPSNYRKSVRNSFIDNFISSRLSDILEFESESVARQTFEDLEFDDRELQEGSDSSHNHSEFVTKLLTSSLGHNERLHNGCVDTENFPLKLNCEGVVLDCSISSSLVSAMTAASIELRSKFEPLSVPANQCQIFLEKNVIQKTAFEPSELIDQTFPPTPSLCQSFLDDSENSGDLDPNNIDLTPVREASSVMSTISLPLLSKFTQALQIQKEKPMAEVYYTYSDCATMLCAVELQIGQDYVLSESMEEIPIRIFSTTIDRQIIGFAESKKKGLDKVAELLRSHRGLLGDSPNLTIDRLSGESKAPDSPQKGTLRQSMLSFIGRRKSSIMEAPAAKESLHQPRRSSLGSPNRPSLSQSSRLAHLSQLNPELFSNSLILQYDEKAIAHNLTMRFHYMFCTIPLFEFAIDYSYPKRKDTPMLNRFRLESDRLQEYLISQILVHDDLMVRAEVIIQIIRVAEVLARIGSHHVLMMAIFALQSQAIHRLKTTWAVVHARFPGRWDILQDLVGFGGQKLTSNFCTRQSVEGVSEDLREELQLFFPNSLELSESVINLLTSNDTKTLKVLDHPEGKYVSFGVIAGKETFPTRGGIVAEGSEPRHLHALHKSSRSASYVELSKNSHELSNLSPIRESKRDSQKYVNVKRQFHSPEIVKLQPRLITKRRHSFPLSKSEFSGVKFSYPGLSSISKDRSVSTSTHNITHLFLPPKGGNDVSRMRTQSDITVDDFNQSYTLEPEQGSVAPDILSGNFSSKSTKYREYLSQRSQSRDVQLYGTVRSDGLGEAGGVPKFSGKPCLPYVNGVIGRIIRLKEIPSYLKTEIEINSKRISCFHCVESPGNSYNDPSLLMINFGKLRAISNLLILVRSSQMTPYKYDVDFEIQYLCAKLPPYRGDDAMWERSKCLE